jgi:hypothetical protein
VEVHQPDPAASETLVAMLRPLVTPFTTTGIVVIFLIFFLGLREVVWVDFTQIQP